MTDAVRVLAIDQGRGLWGAQSYLLRLRALMAGGGVEMILGGPSDLDLARAWKAAGGVHVEIDLPIDRSIRSSARGSLNVAGMARAAGSIPVTTRRIADAARAVGADVLYPNSHWIHLDTAIAGRLTRTPVVLQLHEQSVPGVGASLRSAAVALSTSAVAVSRAVAADVSPRVASRVRVIANGVDLDAYAPQPRDDRLRAVLGAGPDDVLVLAACRLDPDKRIEDLITAVAAIGDPSVRLALVGSTSAHDDYAQSMRELAAERLGDRALFLGRREDMPDVLAACDVLLHAGVVEGMPLGLIEAMACGKPVVAYSISGIPEIVEHGQAGLLAPAGDVDELGAHLASLVSDPGLRDDMGAIGRKRAEERHDLSRQVERHIELVTAASRRGSAR